MSTVSELKSSVGALSAAEKNELLLFLASDDKDNGQILSSLVSKVSASIPELANVSEASKVGRLLKLFSLMIYEYNHLTYDEFYNNFFLHSASGEFLDEYAKEVGISRHLLNKARGKIRVGSSKREGFPATLPLLFTVSTLETASRPALKYKVIAGATIPADVEEEPYSSYYTASGESAPVDSNEPVRTVYWAISNTDTDVKLDVEIEAEEGGADYNLPVGQITEILTKFEPFDMIAQVGEVEGGYDRESDESLRRRILEKHRSGFELSESYIISHTKEEVPSVEDALLIRASNGPGTVELVLKVAGGGDAVIEAVEKLWSDNAIKLPGFTVIPVLASRQPVNIEVDFYYTDLTRVIEDDLSKVFVDYFANLSMGEPFVKEYLEKDLAQVCIRQGIKYFVTKDQQTKEAMPSIILPEARRYFDLGNKIFNLIAYGSVSNG